ncbi:MAG: hypothetical protein WA941_12690 [Nitrososphaeraceae archaeon]
MGLRNFTDDTDRGNMSGVKFSIVAANNHHAGFGPDTVNIFRQLIDLEEVKWGEEYILKNDLETDGIDSKMNKRVMQTSLSDFWK